MGDRLRELTEAARDDEGRDQLATERVIDAAREVVEQLGYKTASNELGRPRPVISMALHRDRAQRKSQHLYAENLVTLARLAPNEQIVDAIASVRTPDHDPDDQVLALLEAAQELFAPEINRTLHASAHAKLIARTRAKRRPR